MTKSYGTTLAAATATTPRCAEDDDAEGRNGVAASLLREQVDRDNDNNNYGISAFRARKEHGVTWRRVLAFLLQLAFLPLYGWILFYAPGATVCGLEMGEGNPVRNSLVFADLTVVLAAYTGKIFYMERQYMLLELFFVLPVLFPAMLTFLCIVARANENPIDLLDVIAVILVVVGIFLNMWPEIERTRWKKQFENTGKLYTEGYFSYVRNPNYLGDVLWAAGWAMSTGSWLVAWIPVMITFVFVVMYIPEKESYLAKRYATEWPAYKAKTVKLFPFIY